MDLGKLKNLAKNPKALVYVAGGAVILYLLYRYFTRGSSGQGGGTQDQPTPDATGLTAAEQVGAQEASDVSQLQDDLGALQDQLTGLTDTLTSAVDPAAGDTPATVIGTSKPKNRKHPKAPAKPKVPTAKKPKKDHPKGHQSNQKHGGSGAVAPSGHGKTPGPKKQPAIVKGGLGPIKPKPKKPKKPAPVGFAAKTISTGAGSHRR